MKVFSIGLLTCIVVAIFVLVLWIKSDCSSEKYNKNIICRKGRNRCFGKNIKWKEYNKKEYKKIIDELMNINKHPFMSGGTLLGYARQQDLLDNDDDLNFSLFDDEYDEHVRNIIKKLGYTLTYVHQTKKGMQLTINKGNIKDDTDVEIDIPIWFRRDGNYYVFAKFTNAGEQYKIDPFHLILTNTWDNLNIYMPSDYKKVLTQKYGDWENPKPNFNYPYDSPAYIKGNIIITPISNMEFPKIMVKEKYTNNLKRVK